MSSKPTVSAALKIANEQIGELETKNLGLTLKNEEAISLLQEATVYLNKAASHIEEQNASLALARKLWYEMTSEIEALKSQIEAMKAAAPVTKPSKPASEKKPFVRWAPSPEIAAAKERAAGISALAREYCPSHGTASYDEIAEMYDAGHRARQAA
jgi:peptidoglycan hydrolase CwlO-like protein